MNNLPIKLIAGFICIARWMMENCDVEAHRCDVRYLKSGVNVDCSGKGIFSVPSDLDLNTNVLDISNNDICKFTRQSFSRYHSLRELVMTDLKCPPVITIDNDTFVISSSLQILDISNSPICSFGSNQFKWPKNLKKLILHYSRHIAFQFSELQSLEILEASNCDKHSFPEFHPAAPLHEIDLRNNNITFVTVEMVARYCDLKVLKMTILLDDLKVHSTEEKPEPPYDDFDCMCQRLRKWVELRDISGLEKLNCIKTDAYNYTNVPSTSKIPCDMSFEIADELYNSCLGKRWNLFIYIAIALVIVIFLILIIVPSVWFLKKSYSIYEGRRSEIIHDHHDRDFPSSYYESGSEMESEYHKGSAKKFSSKKISKKFSSKKIPAQSTPRKLSPTHIPSQSNPTKHTFKPIQSQSIPTKLSPKEVPSQSVPTKLNSEQIPSRSIPTKRSPGQIPSRPIPLPVEISPKQITSQSIQR